MSTFLTLPEYADYKGLARSTVYQMARDGRLKTVKQRKIIPRSVVVPCVLVETTDGAAVNSD